MGPTYQQYVRGGLVGLAVVLAAHVALGGVIVEWLEGLGNLTGAG